MKFSPEEVANIARIVGVTLPDDPRYNEINDVGRKMHEASYSFVLAVLEAAETVLNNRAS